MTKSRIFLILSLSFIVGVFARSIWRIDILFCFLLLAAAVIILAVFWENKVAAVAAFSFFFLALGIWRTDTSLQKLNNLNLDGKEFSGKVWVVKEPEPKENYQKVIVETQYKEKFLINAPLFSEINYGDEINLKCNLKIPEQFSEGFDYQMYLAKDGILYLCQKADMKKAGINKGNKIYPHTNSKKLADNLTGTFSEIGVGVNISILNFKNKMAGVLQEMIPQPEAALANGLIFGGTSSMSKDVQNNFSKTGMSHIVAVSGYNVTIIAEYLILFFIFIGLWRKQAFWAAIVGIFIFVAMTGFPSSAVRAGVMGSLLLWAMKNGRLANSWNAIIFAAGIMLLLNPLLLKWDIGFQLSFLATIGIVVFSPFWEKVFIKKHKALGFSEIFCLSFSAQIFVLPIIMFNFHTLSLVSLVANLLILPIIPLSMLLVFMVSVAGLFSGYLALPFAWIAFLPLKYEMFIINTLANISWSSKVIENFSWQMMATWYAILFALVFLLRKKLNRQVVARELKDKQKDNDIF
jgi:competence protein ComEC